MIKRFLLLFTFAICTEFTMSQHIKFLGQPLGCPITEFKQRMTSRGYQCNGEVSPNCYSFIGRFGGDEVEVASYITPKSKIVFRIAVIYSNYSHYSGNSASERTHKNKIEILKQSYIKKYGKPTLSDETGIWWFLDEGEITIKSSEMWQVGKKEIMIWYNDKIGSTKYTIECESDY